MTHMMAIKLIRTQKRLSTLQVAKKMDEIKQDTLRKRIHSPSILMTQFVEILDALDYQLVFQPKGKETLPEKCYPIRLSDYDLNK